MKTIFPALVAALVLCLTPMLHAQADAKRTAAAEELLKVMRLEEMLGKQKENIEKMVASRIPPTMPPETLKQVQDAVMDIVTKQLSWDVIKGDFIQIYSEVYTEAELRDLITFYKSPLGQKVVEKLPEIQSRTAEVIQKRMITLSPALQQAVKDVLSKAKPADPALSPAK